MSQKYENYLVQHGVNVGEGYRWLKANLPEVLEDCPDIGRQIEVDHDRSKRSKHEYDAYDKYFYGGNKSFEVVENFRIAWLHHIHHNPHHWQYWVLINDDPGEGMVILDMPYNYIVEMICDWWAFSWTKGDLYEVFDWYDKHKKYMKLSDKTRATVESILDKIWTKLEESDA